MLPAPAPRPPVEHPGPRSRTRRAFLPGLALLPALCLPACLIVISDGERGGSGRVHESRHLRVAHLESSDLVVHNPGGGVRIEASGRPEVEFEARLSSRTSERLMRAEPYAERRADGTLEVGVRWPEGGRRSHESAELTVRLPDAGLVRVRTANGSIAVQGVGTEVDLVGSNGGIQVRDVPGQVRARTSNGSIEVAGGERLDLESSNGRVRAIGARGPVDARSSNGPVEIELDPSNAGPVQANTSNGPVLLVVGPAFEGRLDLGTNNGRLNLEGATSARLESLARTRAELSFGSGRSPSRLRTSNGNVTLRVLEPAPEAGL